jgi:hypothetical protein
MLGPLEHLVVGFTGNDFDGNALVAELVDKDDPRFAGFAGLLEDRMALFTPEDLETIASELPDGTGGLALLFEHRWAEGVKEAMARAGGFLVTRSVVPPEGLEEVQAELDAAMVPA